MVTRTSVGKVAVAGIDLCFSQDITSLTPDSSKLDVLYLVHFLRTKELYFKRQSRGATIKGVTKAILENLEIPLPPIAEQKRIAAILDKAEELRDLRRKALEKLDTMTHYIFLEMFGDPAINPKEWKRCQLIDLCEIDAPLVDPKKPEYLDLLHYGPDRIERDTGELLSAKTAREDGVESVKFLFDENYVLYSKIRPYLNKAALAEGKGLCSADVYPVKPKPGLLIREFLLQILLNKDFLNYASGFSNRANIPKINRDQFLRYPTICPPVSRQEEFACHFQKSKQLKATHRQSLAQLDALFASLQHRAFRGEL